MLVCVVLVGCAGIPVRTTNFAEKSLSCDETYVEAARIRAEIYDRKRPVSLSLGGLEQTHAGFAVTMVRAMDAKAGHDEADRLCKFIDERLKPQAVAMGCDMDRFARAYFLEGTVRYRADPRWKDPTCGKER